jgi:hypothetical protein
MRADAQPALLLSGEQYLGFDCAVSWPPHAASAGMRQSPITPMLRALRRRATIEARY